MSLGGGMSNFMGLNNSQMAIVNDAKNMKAQLQYQQQMKDYMTAMSLMGGNPAAMMGGMGATGMPGMGGVQGMPPGMGMPGMGGVPGMPNGMGMPGLNGMGATGALSGLSGGPMFQNAFNPVLNMVMSVLQLLTQMLTGAGMSSGMGSAPPGFQLPNPPMPGGGMPSFPGGGMPGFPGGGMPSFPGGGMPGLPGGFNEIPGLTPGTTPDPAAEPPGLLGQVIQGTQQQIDFLKEGIKTQEDLTKELDQLTKQRDTLKANPQASSPLLQSVIGSLDNMIAMLQEEKEQQDSLKLGDQIKALEEQLAALNAANTIQ